MKMFSTETVHRSVTISRRYWARPTKLVLGSTFDDVKEMNTVHARQPR